MKPRKKKADVQSAKSYDELDAVREISGILEIFQVADRERILRWVRERLDMDGGPVPDAQTVVVAETPRILLSQAAVARPSRLLKNPHEMAKPPLNKVIIQDDDDEGDIIGIPKDADLPEPEGIDLLKPKGPARKLVTKKYKDGSTATVLE